MGVPPGRQRLRAARVATRTRRPRTSGWPVAANVALGPRRRRVARSPRYMRPPWISPPRARRDPRCPPPPPASTFRARCRCTRKPPLLGRWFPRMALRLTGISTPADSTGAAGGVPLPATQPTSVRWRVRQPARHPGAHLPRDQQPQGLPGPLPDGHRARRPPRALLRPGPPGRGRYRRRRPDELVHPGHAGIRRRRHRRDRRPRARAPRAGPPQLRRRRPVRAVEPRRRPRDLQGSARPRSGAAAPQAQPGRAGPSPARGQPEPPLAQAAPRLGARRSQHGPARSRKAPAPPAA